MELSLLVGLDLSDGGVERWPMLSLGSMRYADLDPPMFKEGIDSGVLFTMTTAAQKLFNLRPNGNVRY